MIVPWQQAVRLPQSLFLTLCLELSMGKGCWISPLKKVCAWIDFHWNGLAVTTGVVFFLHCTAWFSTLSEIQCWPFSHGKLSSWFFLCVFMLNVPKLGWHLRYAAMLQFTNCDAAWCSFLQRTARQFICRCEVQTIGDQHKFTWASVPFCVLSFYPLKIKRLAAWGSQKALVTLVSKHSKLVWN